MPPAYAELHCLSNFTFLRGASHPEELVARAAALGYGALALTDECSLSAAVRAHVAAKEHGLQLIIGSELRLDDETRLVVLATDRAGYGQLSQLITLARRRAPKGGYALTRADLAEGLPGCLVVWVPPHAPHAPQVAADDGTSGGGAGVSAPLPGPGQHAPGMANRLSPVLGVTEALRKERPRLAPAATDDAGDGVCSSPLPGPGPHAPGVANRAPRWGGLPESGAAPDLAGASEGLATARWLAGTFPDRAWIAVELHRGPRDGAHGALLERWGQASGLPLVAAGDVHMHERRRRPLQDLLTAIRLGTTVAEAGLALFANGERYLRPREALARLYRPQWLAESVRIAARCRFSLDELRYEYPLDCVAAGESAAATLRRLTLAGAGERWPDGTPPRVTALLEHELAVISELHYEPYFLTVHDIVLFARSRAILCQGRGSAANSAVCYCLGITAVDPSRAEMLFERFISRERGEPPDIDIDFEHERREEVIQYLYQRYGRERAALAATVIRYRRRSALRDVGKALGLSLDQVERLGAAVAWWDQGIPEERLLEAGFDPQSATIRHLVALASELLGFPRHLSQHVGGFVISRGPLAQLVPIENAGMAQRTVIQWDKDDLDALGLLKIDVLALGMLSAIRRCFDLLARHRGLQLSLATLPAEDPTVYAMISRADTLGVFQIESRAQMSMLPRLRPRCFYDLVIEVAIVRPGPIQGEMVHPYLRRRQGLEPVSYPSEAVREVLARTLGVPIFQEQVIKLAMVAAGFTAGEADQLRRAIGVWRKHDTLERFRRQLIDGMAARGYEMRFAEQIYAQIQGFGEYGFPESHAASFALLVYASAWLKCFEPAAYACALLNSQPMGFYAPAQLVQDAQRHGVAVCAVDALVSVWESTLEPLAEGNDAALALRLGLSLVKGLSRDGAARLVAARGQRPFASVADLAQRARLTRGDLAALAEADALQALAGDRHHAHWQTLGSEAALPLFEQLSFTETMPVLAAPGEVQELLSDYRSVGLSLRSHPLQLLRPLLHRRRITTSGELAQRRDGALLRVAGLVITRQRPGAGNVVFLTLEDEHGTLNVIVWARLADRFRREVLQGRLLLVHGQLQREGEVTHIIAGRIEEVSHLLGEIESRSRDFC